MKSKESYKAFARNLKDYMNRDSYTYEALGAKIGRAPSAIGAWCRAEKQPTMEMVDKLCEIFHCRRKDLIDEPEPVVDYIDLTVLNEQGKERMKMYFEEALKLYKR